VSAVTVPGRSSAIRCPHRDPRARFVAPAPPAISSPSTLSTARLRDMLQAEERFGRNNPGHGR